MTRAPNARIMAGATLTIMAAVSAPTAVDGVVTVWSAVTDTVRGIGTSSVAGTPVPAIVPECSPWELAMQSASVTHGEYLHLACIPTHTV